MAKENINTEIVLGIRLLKISDRQANTLSTNIASTTVTSTQKSG
ncbi:hypothetical protein JCM19233_3432 [Vibrio astriarenae]|nr:hypothetical protein JCM19233_3432 [Vibrio sp. C7]